MERAENRNTSIVIATGLYPPDIGGPATYAKMLEEVLPSHDFELTVMPFGTVRHYPKVIRHVVYAWRLRRHAKNSDLIYALDPISVGLPAWLVSKLTGVPYAVRLGGDYAWEQGQQRFGLTISLDEYTKNPGLAPLPVRLLARLQNFVVKRAQKVVVPSEYLKHIVATWGVQSESLVRIYSVLHPIEVTDSRDALRTRLNYSTPTIVTAGRLVPWKGMAALLKVVQTLQSTYPEINLVIIGDGTERARLESEAATLNITPRVRFTGSLSKDALGAAVKAADVFVLNTSYEGMSHQLLEVMDIGTPVITTPVGGNVELLEPNNSGVLVQFNDVAGFVNAINHVMTSPEAVRDMTAAAKVRVADFERHVVTKQLVALLHGITK